MRNFRKAGRARAWSRRRSCIALAHALTASMSRRCLVTICVLRHLGGRHAQTCLLALEKGLLSLEHLNLLLELILFH